MIKPIQTAIKLNCLYMRLIMWQFNYVNSRLTDMEERMKKN